MYACRSRLLLLRFFEAKHNVFTRTEVFSIDVDSDRLPLKINFKNDILQAMGRDSYSSQVLL